MRGTGQGLWRGWPEFGGGRLSLSGDARDSIGMTLCMLDRIGVLLLEIKLYRI
jgi:hypothetical protein